MRIPIYLAAASMVGLLHGNICLADDLDDGIAKPVTDEAIAKDDEIGQADRNIKFLKQKAKGQARMDQSSGRTGQSGDSNMNSVVLGAGSNVRGDIIIIDESRGNKTQVR